MDSPAVLAAFDEQLRRSERSIGGDRVERVGPVLRRIAPNPDEWSMIEWSDLDESTADDAIAAQVAYFSGLGQQFEWKYYAYDRPADLPRRLRRAGLEPDEEEALMVADVTDLAVDLAPPDGIRFVPVIDANGVGLLVRLHEEVFGHDYTAFGRALATRLDSEPESVTPVLAMAGDRPVCASRIEFHQGTDFASLWGGGTLPEWRNKGIYRAMVGYRARLAAERGFRYLQVDAQPPSRPILERLGFVMLTTTVPYTFGPR
jgi:GNAT superfamily N-acetyltransferase